MKSLPLLLALLTVPVVARADEKADVKADYELICNAVERSGADSEKDPSQKAQKIAMYLLKNIKTQQVRSFMARMGSLPPDQKGPTLKKAATDAGYTGKCPFADAK